MTIRIVYTLFFANICRPMKSGWALSRVMQWAKLSAMLGLILIGYQPTEANTDSLRRAFPLVLNDTAKANLLIELCNQLYFEKPDEMMPYADSLYQLGHRINLPLAKINALNFKALYRSYKTDFASSNAFYFQCLEECRANNLTRGVAATLNNISINYIDNKEYDKAEAILVQLKESLTDLPEDAEMQTAYYVNRGNIYFEKADYESALQFFDEAIKIDLQPSSTENHANALVNRAACKLKLKQLEPALADAYTAKHFSEQHQSVFSQAYSSYYLAEIYSALVQWDSAHHYLHLATQWALDLEWPQQLLNTYELANKIALSQQDSGTAYRFLRLIKDLEDSLYTVEKATELALITSAFELKEKDMENHVLKLEQQSKSEVIQTQKGLLIFASIAMLLIVVVAVILFRLNRIQRKANHELEAQRSEMARMNKELEEANEVKNVMLSIVSHDLRTPIHNLQAVIELLGAGGLTEKETYALLNDLRAQVGSTVSMLDNLLYWAKSQMEGVSVTQSVFNINELAASVIQLFRPMAHNKQISIDFQYSAAIVAFADKNMIELVIRNLLSNALKFSAPGDGVSVLVEDKLQAIKITVTDQAGGIEEFKLKTLFKSVQTPSRGTSNERGAGLGLKMCADFVRLNGGEISVESQLGKGSSFWFTVPKAS